MKRLIAIALVLCGCLAGAQTRLTLQNVHKVFIEKMNNNLDQYLTTAILKQFHGSLQVVLDRAHADAILHGAPQGAQNHKATVELVDPSGQEVLWSGSAGDRNKEFLGVMHGGEQTLAEKLVAQLKKAMQR
jgi:hypothetical protein